MAEIAAEVAKELAILLKDEAVFLYGVRDQVEQMERELQRMQAFLEYADEHYLEFKSDPRTRTYVNQMREIAFEGEDVVEEFMVKEQQKKRKLSEGILSGFCKRYACIFCTLKDRHDIGTEIENINKKINEITNSLKTYGTNNFSISEASTNQGMKQGSRPQPLLPPDEKDIIGLDDQANDIMVRLGGQDGRQRVLPIIGMGGLGKTTLARKVYNRVKASMDFQCLAWITVSKEYNRKELLQLMVKEIMGDGTAKELFDKMLSEEELARAISEFLMKMKYFIVLDDIWSDKFWETAKEIKFLSTKPSIEARRLKVTEFAGNDNDDIVEDKLVYRNLRALFAFKPNSQQLKNLCDGSPRVKYNYSNDS
ncbi:putative disease resistance protein [Acorus calamus]|uniref:Disease resistance protein n=1 Tax=Acorus calamus TaxID=4465 RepID=A0AAV9DSQ5_ACOCL|nr:putative disease resistance protein [Acorus calamus]